MHVIKTLSTVALTSFLSTTDLHAQFSFGTSCAGASGVTPTLAVSGSVETGQNWTLEVTAPGGLGLGLLAIGFSSTTATALGGNHLPLDLGVYFGDPLWSGCELNIDPSYVIQPYLFDPNANGGLATFTFPGFDIAAVYLQAINLDADFATRIAGVSQGLIVPRTVRNGMCAIPPGTLVMGTNAVLGEPSPGPDPYQIAHPVTITYPYWMRCYEVTQTEYAALMGVNPSFTVGPNRPVGQVTWYQARAYCAALNELETLAGNVPAGYEYRLPTEAEWEHACRAGTTTEFNVGDELLCSDAVIGAEGDYSPNPTYCPKPGFPLDGALDVGLHAPNAWGLHDMHGNMSEWCLDSYAEYDSAPLVDPFVTGVGVLRVTRGGSGASFAAYCGSSYRLAGFPFIAPANVGFRVVLGPILVP